MNYLIDPYLQEITDELIAKKVVVVKAGPGAGKTTRLPPYLLKHVSGKILVLVPRRLAAKLAAKRCADLAHEKVGETIGHRVRGDSLASAQTRLEFITEGLFIRILMENPTLQGIGAVILDEFHERHLHTDVSLCLIQKLRFTSRKDLLLVVMSATLNSSELETYLSNCSVFDIPGRVFPLTVEYHPPTKAESEDLFYFVAKKIWEISQDQRCAGNILVFLPGQREIRQTETYLKCFELTHFVVLPLFADLSVDEQNRVFTPSSKNKIILATNVAETSLTIEGVTKVVDLGMAKKAVLAHWSGMSVLELSPISKDSATQRAGRAGRTAEGLVWRLYSETEFRARADFQQPEILRLDFTSTYLELLTMGLAVTELPWFVTPEKKLLEHARQTLVLLDAVEDGKLTAIGAQMGPLPFHPRLARALVEAQKLKCSGPVLLLNVLISENALGPNTLDIWEMLQNLGKKSFGMERSWEFRLYQKIASQLQISPWDFAKITVSDLQTKISLSFLRGFPDRIGQRQGNKKFKNFPLYNFCQGRGGFLPLQGTAADHPPTYIIAIEAKENLKISGDQGSSIQLFIEIDESALINPELKLYDRKIQTIINETRGPESWELEQYGDLVLRKNKIQKSHQVDQQTATFAKYLIENWNQVFEGDESLDQYHGRLKTLEQMKIAHQLPVMRDEILELWAHSLCEKYPSLPELKKIHLEAELMGELTEEEKHLLNKFAPKTFKAENGKTFQIHYSEKNQPTLKAMIQDFYGIKDHPKLLSKLPLRLELLGPHKRCVQVTSDLVQFWKGSYGEIKKELAGDYPKHHWATDPQTAPPIVHKNKL